MTKKSGPTYKDIRSDIRWTKDYIKQILAAKKSGEYALAAELANEISAIWGTISGDFDEADRG